MSILINFLNLENKDTTCKLLVQDYFWEVLAPKSCLGIVGQALPDTNRKHSILMTEVQCQGKFTGLVNVLVAWKQTIDNDENQACHQVSIC